MVQVSEDIDEEKQLFGFLCSDYLTLKEYCGENYNEKLLNLFRCYYNNEVMRRYIVLRKVLGEKVLLYNESCDVERQFILSSPLAILSKKTIVIA